MTILFLFPILSYPIPKPFISSGVIFIKTGFPVVLNIDPQSYQAVYYSLLFHLISIILYESIINYILRHRIRTLDRILLHHKRSRHMVARWVCRRRSYSRVCLPVQRDNPRTAIPLSQSRLKISQSGLKKISLL